MVLYYITFVATTPATTCPIIRCFFTVSYVGVFNGINYLCHALVI